MADLLHEFAVNCNNLAALEGTFSIIIGRHANLGVEAWHYPLVGECLIEAMR